MVIVWFAWSAIGWILLRSGLLRFSLLVRVLPRLRRLLPGGPWRQDTAFERAVSGNPHPIDAEPEEGHDDRERGPVRLVLGDPREPERHRPDADHDLHREHHEQRGAHRLRCHVAR